MRRRHAPFAVPFIGLMVASWAQAAARDLTFEDRVKAQEAIERVYYSHQVGATKRFEMAVPRSLLEQKVRTYLRQSVALERLWHTPVTAEALRGELGRMARQTRAPERLRELYEALHGDAGLIEECLARPLLVDRLTRNFFAYDDRIHAETRRAAEHLRGRLLSADLDPDADDPRRSVVDVVRSATGRAGGLVAGRRSPHATESGPPRMELTPDEYVRWRAEIPARPGEVGPVAQTADAFVIRTLLAEDAARTRVATYVVPKITWDAWWQSAAVEMDDARARTVASPLDPLPLPSTASETGGPQDATALCETDDTWIDGGLADEAPHAGDGQSVVWTGSVMVVWGGLYVTDFETYLNTGSRYDPATDTWASTSTRNAPCGRYGQAAVWTGSEMIVWGGEIACGDNSGGRYDPFSDTWTPVSTLDAPPNGGSQTAVWTGSEMIVWGGDDPTGGRYDPARDAWLPIATLGAPSGRSEQTAVWTGREMLIWGGAACVTTCDQLNTGARYDPASDTWSAISTLGAPSPRWSHTAVWTGSEMLIWGGFSNTADAGRSGGRYDPGRDSWSPITTTAAPAGVSLGAGAVWTGRYMVVGAGGASTGGRYDASADVWLPVSNLNAPGVTGSSVWTGCLLVVWNGGQRIGGRYDPSLDAWTPVARPSAPVARHGHSAVWTGNEMLVFGGVPDIGDTGHIFFLSAGARFDPATGQWRPISTLGQPGGRAVHSVVWTGGEMIVWGGLFRFCGPCYVSTTYLNTGGRYDPISDRWLPTSTTNAPSERGGHTAVWTGREMIVWGGQVEDGETQLRNFDDGGRYDPETDTWTAVSVTDAPEARTSHSAIWTGNEMIVWGGEPRRLLLLFDAQHRRAVRPARGQMDRDLAGRGASRALGSSGGLDR